MKTDVTDVYSRPKGHTEGLDRAIEIFVIDREFIVPDAGRRIRHVVADKENAIVTRIGLDLVHSGTSSCPGLDCRLHSHCATNGAKRETRSARDMELTVRDIVKHVALVRMTLAPGIFMRSNVCGFAEIRRIWIQCRVQVAVLDPDPVRHAVVVVAVVVVGGRWEGASKGIDPGA
jgi:hypothetical protein